MGHLRPLSLQALPYAPGLGPLSGVMLATARRLTSAWCRRGERKGLRNRPEAVGQPRGHLRAQYLRQFVRLDDLFSAREDALTVHPSFNGAWSW
jgi:hypothetical protein